MADTWNNTIRKITPAGVVTTLAGLAGNPGSDDGSGSVARFDRPRGLACDGSGNLYVADGNNQTIRKITPAGAVTTLAGMADQAGGEDGTGSAARFSNPEAIVSTASGTLYVGEFGSPRIRKITSAGVVTTLAGHTLLKGMERGTGPVARFTRPGGLALSGDALFYSDTLTHSIKRGLPAFATVATIDDASAPINETRQLEATPDPGTSVEWVISRKPTLSAATIVSSSSASTTFTPDVPDTYIIRLTASDGSARSITTVRTAVNAVRALAGLAPTSFTDAALAGIPIKAVHLTQLRSGLNGARTTLGLGALTYTDSSPGGDPVKAVHIQELRNGVK